MYQCHARLDLVGVVVRVLLDELRESLEVQFVALQTQRKPLDELLKLGRVVFEPRSLRAEPLALPRLLVAAASIELA